MGTTPCLPAKALPLSKDEGGQTSMQKSMSKDEGGQESMQKSMSKDDGGHAQKNAEEIIKQQEAPSNQQEAPDPILGMLGPGYRIKEPEVEVVAKVVAPSRVVKQQEPMKVGDLAKIVASGKVGTVWALHPDDRLYHCKLDFKDGVLPPVHWYSKDAVALVKSVVKHTEDTTISKDGGSNGWNQLAEPLNATATDGASIRSSRHVTGTSQATHTLDANTLHSLDSHGQAESATASAGMAHSGGEGAESLFVSHTDQHTGQCTRFPSSQAAFQASFQASRSSASAAPSQTGTLLQPPPPLPPPESPPHGGEQSRLEHELGLQRAMLQANLGRAQAAQAMEVAQLEEVLQKVCGRASQRSRSEADLERQRAASAAECRRIEDELQQAQAQAAQRAVHEAELERKMHTEEPAKLHAELKYAQAETEEYKCKLACEMNGLKRENEKSRAEHLSMVEELQLRLEEERGIANLIRERDQLLERDGNARAMHLLKGRLDEIGAEANALRQLVDDLQTQLTDAEGQKGKTLEEQDKMREDLEEAVKAQDVLRKARDEFEQKLEEVREKQPRCGPSREGQPQCTACAMM